MNQAEAETLQNWLRANQTTDNPYVSRLLDQVERVLKDGVLDDDEGRELHDALMNWTGGGGADGEESTTGSLRSTRHRERYGLRTHLRFHGNRRIRNPEDDAGRDNPRRRHGGAKHHDADELRGARNVRYASLAHQSFGEKDEKAMEYRDRKGTGVQIVHEEDWVQALGRSGLLLMHDVPPNTGWATRTRRHPRPRLACTGKAGCERGTGAMPCRRASLQVILPFRLSS